MSENTTKQDLANVGGQLSEFLSKNGLATFLLLGLLYVLWTSFLEPASRKHLEMLESVTASNASLTSTISELKDGLKDVGIRNTELGNANRESLQNIEEHIGEIEKLSRDIDRKLDLLGRPSYMPQQQEPQVDE